MSRHRATRTLTRAFPLVAFAVTVAACGREVAGPPAHGAAGTSRLLITDDPFPYDQVARVDLYVVSVSGSLSADTSAGGGAFVTLAEPHRRINVLALQNGTTEELGTANLAPGAITAMRMTIDTDSSSITLKDGRVLTGKSTPGIAWQSSAGRPVLNALIPEQIQVPDSGAVAVAVYDVGEAFFADGSGGFIFSPVFRAADATRTGSISGTVRAHSAAGMPVAGASLQLYLGQLGTAENSRPRIATATTNASGEFKFAFVPRSSLWTGAMAGAVYMVAIDGPTGAGLTRQLIDSIRVSPRQDVSLGTVVLP